MTEKNTEKATTWHDRMLLGAYTEHISLERDKNYILDLDLSK